MINNLPEKSGKKLKKTRVSDWETYKRLLSYLRGTHWAIVLIFVCMILESVFTALSFGLAKPLIDVAMNKPLTEEIRKKPKNAEEAFGFIDQQKQAVIHWAEPWLHNIETQALADSHFKFQILFSIIGLMLFCGFMMVLASFATGYLSSYLATKAVQKLRNHVYSHLIKMDLSFFSKNSTGSMMSLVIQDVQAVDGALDTLFSSILKNPVKIFFFIIMMTIISPSLTLITFTVLPVIGLVIYLIGKRIRRVSQKIQATKAVLSSILEETFTGMRVIKAYNMEDIEARRFEKRTRQVFRMGLKTTASEEMGSSLTQFLGLVTVAMIALAGTWFVLVKEELSISSFVVFAGLLTQVFRPLKGASKVSSKIQKGLAGCDRVFAILDTHPSIQNKPSAVNAPLLKNALSFDNVSFLYSNDKPPALKNINLTIPAGSAIALVGETGSGKSTLANLIPRFFDPTEGRVLYDGIDLRDLKINSLRDNLAIVTQDVVLFDDTVANNISYGLRGTASLEQIQEAAKAAKAHDFIMRLPLGYDTPIGSRGSRLSGGERQRLAIARAILKNAPILILDEATSALDSETESLIQEALNNLIHGRTTIVIAHRLSTIKNCDTIYVLNQGEIMEAGNHGELMEKNGQYARFHSIQFATPS